MFTAKHKASGRYGVITPDGDWLDDFLGTKEEAEAKAGELNAELDNKSVSETYFNENNDLEKEDGQDETALADSSVGSTNLSVKSGDSKLTIGSVTRARVLPSSSGRPQFKLTDSGWLPVSNSEGEV